MVDELPAHKLVRIPVTFDDYSGINLLTILSLSTMHATHNFVTPMGLALRHIALVHLTKAKLS